MRELTRRDWLKGTSSLAAASLVYATTAQAQSVTVKGYTPTRENPIRMSANENPFGISRSAKNAMSESWGVSHLYARSGQNELRQLYADMNGVNPNNVLLASGSKEILKVMALITKIEGGRVLSANPTFHDLVRYADWVDTDITWVDVHNEDMSIDLDAMRKAYTDDVKIIYLCNPNNPIPTIIEKQALREFVLEMSQKCYVFVDEAYHEFVTDSNYGSMAEVAATTDNVIVSRTASKIHGFAGVRIGFAIAKPELLRKISRRVTGTIATPSVMGAIASYKDKEFMDFVVRKNKEGLEEVYKVFDKHNVRHFKSNANFTFFETGLDFKETKERFLKHGIDVGRPFPPFTTWARVSIQKPEDMKYFAEVYEKEFVG
ncbi:pyridoxal phosphate-dependent aminotransferase [Pseudemcibacter aquimaris]|uniref:pyridoxal phosphate-dependent aminotransferase n=1 Tax=Pseudemcibacter aquimaris TaxID=2857064 RepID=UPI0020120CA1|nr:histidinol-phosphate transaminase [Pseudemcibacter aquimaris]MCC3860266.1 histidinol-phosphate aminotransferase family protein [Pseudemcibacter aquimaris]WDU57591.1 histidinol-phosphate aminotransferase family protein [Pseudemcibacter aquimaris]